MQPPQSYSVGEHRSSGQLTGKPTGARPDNRGCWCAICRGHPDQPKPPPPGVRPIVFHPQRASVHGRQWNSLDSNGNIQAIGRILPSTLSAFTGCATWEPLQHDLKCN
ncbi:UNVERIFIED_CONTAM: hypothetical protein FKN15_076694 [Acipenser sinensis]